MRIAVLSENTSSSEGLKSEHGLSLYIQTKRHKLLFDTGASDVFAQNAATLDIDLRKVDVAVISHGHYDHGGGLKTFLDINNNAKIYLHKDAFIQHFANRPNGEKSYIGLNKKLLPNPRFVFCGDSFTIDEELSIFSGIQGNTFLPSENSHLLIKKDDYFTQDDFPDEQNLSINLGGKTLLLAGCAHHGIINILDHYIAIRGFPPDYVISGFHLYNHGTGKTEDPKIVSEIGSYLLHTGAQYYTCHCTGLAPFHRLKEVMGEKIQYLSAGDQLTLDM